jgi:hypothetical protein
MGNCRGRKETIKQSGTPGKTWVYPPAPSGTGRGCCSSGDTKHDEKNQAKRNIEASN